MSDHSVHFRRPSGPPGFIVALAIAALFLLPPPRPALPSEDGWNKVQQIAKVIDGDTVLLSNGRLVRYIGIDAPEIDHRSGVAEAYGFEAWQFHRRTLQNGGIRLQFDRQRYDRYGRILVYAFTPSGTMINELLLEKGLAQVFFHRQNHKYNQRLLRAQRQAMLDGAGIWKFWSETAKGPFIGNRLSRRFHLPQCPMGRKISEANRILLPTAWKAFYLGFSPCRACQPPRVSSFQARR